MACVHVSIEDIKIRTRSPSLLTTIETTNIVDDDFDDIATSTHMSAHARTHHIQLTDLRNKE